jgi:hypothetical protein
MSARPDLVVTSPDNRILLVVEVKSRPNASAAWAAELRRNLTTHGVLPEAPYFLLALPDKFFLWKQTGSAPSGPPDYEVDAEDVLRPYLRSIKSPLAELSESGFESLVRLWLEDLVQNTSTGQPRWLHASGLDEVVHDGVVTSQMAA